LYSGLRRPAVRRGMYPVLSFPKQKYSALKLFDESKENISSLFACNIHPEKSQQAQRYKKKEKNFVRHDNNR
jgi:hypothetical protein